MKFRELLINQKALRRITRVYVPLVIAVWLLLEGLGFVTGGAAPKLDLQQDFAHLAPVVYSDKYNIEFFGLEKLHPFDTAKYRRILEVLVTEKMLARGKIIPAAPPDDALLSLAESDEYLNSLKSSWSVAGIMELPFLRFFPSRLTRHLVLEPMLYQTGGSVLAAKAALVRGAAVNLGGGFHHASHDRGMGFCPYADISLVIKYLRQQKLAQKFLIIDLDAHQGNGHETDFGDDADVYILDAYNGEVFPHDEAAKRGIDGKVELPAFSGDAEYFPPVRRAIEASYKTFKPDLVIYNAGTDVLTGDPLGALDISAEGIVKRDEMVFQKALAEKTPIVMLLSGGYQKSNAAVIAASLLNLRRKFGLFKAD